jgi:hypothetical protein
MHGLHVQANAVTIAGLYSAADRRRQACTIALTRSGIISLQSVPPVSLWISRVCGSELKRCGCAPPAPWRPGPVGPGVACPVIFLVFYFAISRAGHVGTTRPRYGLNIARSAAEGKSLAKGQAPGRWRTKWRSPAGCGPGIRD